MVGRRRDAGVLERGGGAEDWLVREGLWAEMVFRSMTAWAVRLG